MKLLALAVLWAVMQATPPSPKAGTDWWYRAYVIFTGALVIVGAIGVGYAIKTLRAIERQAKANEGQLAEIKAAGAQTDRMIEHTAIQAQATKDAAEAAQKSAQALMDGERAWLLVEDVEIPSDPIAVAIQEAGDGPVHVNGSFFGLPIPGAIFNIRNYGKTPGRILTTEARLEIGPSRTSPPNPEEVYGGIPFKAVTALLTGAEIETIEEHVVPQGGERAEIARYHSLNSSLSDEKLTRIKNDADFLWAYGVIRYRDVYDRDHETRFCYRYIVPPEEPICHLCLRGPEQYNKAT
jgi:hypothetical protein